MYLQSLLRWVGMGIQRDAVGAPLDGIANNNNTLEAHDFGGKPAVTMASPDAPEPSPDLSVADQLDKEIASLRAQGKP